MSDLDELADLLREKTDAGKLRWQLRSDDLITLKQGDHYVEVREWEDSLEFVLRNINGVSLSRSTYHRGTKIGENMKVLFDKARRNALGLDEAIADVKQRLLQL